MIRFENGPSGGPGQFDGPSQVILAWNLTDVAPALAQLDAARNAGAWVAGWIGYEAGLALEPRLASLARPTLGDPLLAFGVYVAPQAATDLPAPPASGDVQLAPLSPMISRADYDRAIARVLRYVRSGDCYQINLTFPLASHLTGGTALDLYAALHHRAGLVQAEAEGFAAYCDLGVGPVVVSRSPELFFAVDSAGQIAARPMKGTAPRSADPAQDASLAQALFHSEKARAENLMIVDLLRNDISRLCDVGSVRVPELFKVEPFATVHQMSSRVTGRLSGDPGLTRLMQALFPCGSITGAPKIRAMQIIAELEPHPRGVYCGAVGWMAPDGRAAFNVAIRTLRVYPDGRVMLNVGGGVVADSTADGEWEEALWKARFASGLVPTNTTPALIPTCG